MGTETFQDQLKSFIGRETGPRQAAPEPVNRPWVRQWVETMGDENPIYLDDDAARATGREGIVAPPAMLQVWNMPGYRRHMNKQLSGDGAMIELIDLLAEHGFTSVVATNCEQTYHRELRPGDLVHRSEVIVDVSDEKRTGLGVGHFLTSEITYTDEHGEPLATMLWRLLRYRPPAAAATPAAAETAAAAETPVAGGRPLRPRPAVNRDNQFWFDAAREHRLLIQRCAACRKLRHPTGPMCPACQSNEWDTVESTGEGTVYSYVVVHHPKHPAFDYPHVVGVVDLAEGTRILTELHVDPEAVEVGMPVTLVWDDHDPDLTLPAFKPRDDSTGAPAGKGA